MTTNPTTAKAVESAAHVIAENALRRWAAGQSMAEAKAGACAEFAERWPALGPAGRRSSRGEAVTREEWLLALVEKLRPLYAGELPEAVRISTGFSSKGARSNVIGECWHAEVADDKCPQIFIHPGQVDSLEVAALVAHELIHACRPEAKHGAKFKAVAGRLGLEGPTKSTKAGPAFVETVAPLLAELGDYPHARLNAGARSSNGPKQTTRMLKVECADCGYTVRTSQKWLDVATPCCPVCELEMVAS